MDHVLAAESIGKRFGRREVVRAAGCWAVPGEITVLLGRNGCGKTTLSRIAVGLLRADTGVVIVANARYRHPRLATLARQGVFFLSQDPWLSPAHTIERHFEALLHHLPTANVAEAIERTGVGPFLAKKPTAVSPGERRCVELALALARRPVCLVADEPFLGLAPPQVELFGDVFRELAGLGAGLWITGHEVEVLLPLADTVVWMTGGTSHHLGTVRSALMHDQFIREYVGAVRLGRLKGAS
jgi:ABC-type multidrug transport system ATPase subunit